MKARRKSKTARSVVSLVERRPPIKDPWTPRELLVEFLADLDAGKIKPVSLMVCFMEETADGGRQPHTWTAGVGYAEAIAFATLEVHRTIDSWKNP